MSVRPAGWVLSGARPVPCRGGGKLLRQLGLGGAVDSDSAGSDVLGQMLAGAGAGDEQDVRRQVEQPGECDLRRSRSQTPAQLGEHGTGEDGVLNAAWPAEGTERDERDSQGAAFVEEIEGALIGKVEQVLHADNLGLVHRSAQVLCGYVAEADPFDDALVARLDERSELRVETLAGTGAVHGSQVHRGQPIETEGKQVF